MAKSRRLAGVSSQSPRSGQRSNTPGSAHTTRCRAFIPRIVVIFRFLQATFAICLAAANLAAQSAPLRSPAQGSSGTPPQAAAKSPGVPAGSPSATPTTEELVNSLGPTDLQAAITLLKNNFADLDAITDTELNRAMVEGLLVRLPRGAMLLA